MARISVNPVGRVRSPYREYGAKRDRREVVSEIVLDEPYSDGLQGIEDFSHLHVIYWAHQALLRRPSALLVHPAGRKDLGPVGVFASRSPNRPNRLCLSLVELLERRGNVLRVKGLDAYDGSPVLDIKPYDLDDLVPHPKVPSWWLKLHGKPRRQRRGLSSRPSSRMTSSAKQRGRSK